MRTALTKRNVQFPEQDDPLAAHALVSVAEQRAWEWERGGRSQMAAFGGHARSKETAVLFPYTLLKGDESVSVPPRHPEVAEITDLRFTLAVESW